MRGQSGGEDFELLGQGRIRTESVPRLSLAHHVDHFDAGQDGGGGGRRFEAEHRPDTTLDVPMVLLDPIVQVLAPADADRLQPAPGAILQAIWGVARNDRLVVGLAPVDDDAIRSAMTLQRLSEEALGRRQVALLAEPKLDCVTDRCAAAKRERMMQGFRSPGAPQQRFVSIFSALRNLFVQPRSKRSALATHIHRLQAMAEWKAVAMVS